MFNRRGPKFESAPEAGSRPEGKGKGVAQEKEEELSDEQKDRELEIEEVFKRHGVLASHHEGLEDESYGLSMNQDLALVADRSGISLEELQAFRREFSRAQHGGVEPKDVKRARERQEEGEREFAKERQFGKEAEKKSNRTGIFFLLEKAGVISRVSGKEGYYTVDMERGIEEIQKWGASHNLFFPAEEVESIRREVFEASEKIKREKSSILSRAQRKARE